jgi:hypothetical protein
MVVLCNFNTKRDEKSKNENEGNIEVVVRRCIEDVLDRYFIVTPFFMISYFEQINII